jgi:hypothetical protein
VVPDGSIIVKENFDAEEKLKNLTVMTKVAEYDPGYSDWFWAMYSAEGEVLREGLVTGCISCHAGMVENDYIIIRRLDAPLK